MEKLTKVLVFIAIGTAVIFIAFWMIGSLISESGLYIIGVSIILLGITILTAVPAFLMYIWKNLF